jgi:hypothetical protein
MRSGRGDMMSNGTSPENRIGDVRNLIAFLVAGFAGVLNVIGLKSAEVGVVLRNDRTEVTIIALLLFVGLATATVSVFFTGNKVPSVLLVFSLFATSLAAYEAVSVEARSQAAAVAEIGDNLQVVGHNDVLTLSVSASKLAVRDWLGVAVFGVPRGHQWNIRVLCSLPASVRRAAKSGLKCSGDPCYFFSHVKHISCSEVSSNIISPNASGSVQQTLRVPISPTGFKHVQVLAGACMPELRPAGKCVPTGSATRIDIAIPKSF